MNGNIVLIGFMGCGKSSVAKCLASEYQYQMIDSDAEIEKIQNRTISDIFSRDGEQAFRTMETQFLKESEFMSEHVVLSTGGGMPLKEENRALLHRIGTVVFLRASKEATYERLKKDSTRPLLNSPDPKQAISDLLDQRFGTYLDAADLIIDTDKMTPQEIAKLIHLQIG